MSNNIRPLQSSLASLASFQKEAVSQMAQIRRSIDWLVSPAGGDAKAPGNHAAAHQLELRKRELAVFEARLAAVNTQIETTEWELDAEIESEYGPADDLEESIAREEVAEAQHALELAKERVRVAIQAFEDAGWTRKEA